MAEISDELSKCQDLEIRLVTLETEWAARTRRETNMPGWVWAAISSITAVVSLFLWWIAGGAP